VTWWTDGIGFDLSWRRVWLWVALSKFDDIVGVHTNKGDEYFLCIDIGPLFVGVGLRRRNDGRR
jgi:hypothetical protein